MSAVLVVLVVSLVLSPSSSSSISQLLSLLQLPHCVNLHNGSGRSEAAGLLPEPDCDSGANAVSTD